MKTLVLILMAALITVSVPGLTRAQQSLGVWTGLQTLPPGDELEVRLKNEMKVTGRFLSATDTTLTLTRKNKPAVFNRDEVARVYRLFSKSKAKATLIGVAGGAATGATIGGVYTATHGAESGEAFLPAFIFGLIGAGLGALAGLAFGVGKKPVLIYEAGK